MTQEGRGRTEEDGRSVEGRKAGKHEAGIRYKEEGKGGYRSDGEAGRGYIQ